MSSLADIQLGEEESLDEGDDQDEISLHKFRIFNICYGQSSYGDISSH